MATRERLARLVDHLEWANRRALEAVRKAGDGEARELLAHVLGAERVWLRRIATGDSSDLEIWPDLTLDECAERAQANVSDLRRLLDDVSGTELDRRVEYSDSRGRTFRTPLWEILLQVLLHGAHHRGQIARRIREDGAEPVNTDFITFVREEPADRD